MWSETLHTDMNTDDEVKIGGVGTGKYWYGEGTFQESNLRGTTKDRFRWSGTADDQNYDIFVEPYISNKGEINDCNEVPTKYLHLFPACNACAGLNYAGFPEGWRLPSQRLVSHDITDYCTDTKKCARESTTQRCCGPNRQLWDLGVESCDWDPNDCSTKETECKPDYDRRAGDGYWTSTQYSDEHAWNVYFSNAFIHVQEKAKTHLSVRCFLGEWP